jgi:hypothetical protein
VFLSSTKTCGEQDKVPYHVRLPFEKTAKHLRPNKTPLYCLESSEQQNMVCLISPPTGHFWPISVLSRILKPIEEFVKMTNQPSIT